MNLFSSISDSMKKRIYAVCGFSALLVIEIIIGMFFGGFIRAYVGDMLIIPLIYCFVRIFYTHENKFLPLAVGGLGILAEVLQYFDICGLLGIDKGSLLGIIIGSTADIKDILCYTAGIILIYITEFAIAEIPRLLTNQQ